MPITYEMDDKERAAEAALMDTAEKADKKESEVKAAMFQGDYGPEAVADLIAALNAVLPFFGMEPIEAAELNEEVIKALEMVAAAAKDAKMEGFSLNPRDDAELDMVIASLMNLASNPDFERFLKSRAPENKEPAEGQDRAPASAAKPQEASGFEDLFKARA